MIHRDLIQCSPLPFWVTFYLHVIPSRMIEQMLFSLYATEDCRWKEQHVNTNVNQR
jgi:hypothetical protein